MPSRRMRVPPPRTLAGMPFDDHAAGLPLLGVGRDADVYALDDRRVLRRYRDRVGDVGGEAAVMRHVARYGFPVPEVLRASGTDLVMARVDGPTLLESMYMGETTPAAGGELLARLLAQLHALPARVSREPGTVVLHRDAHPANVLLGQGGPVLIDWSNATEGAPELDIALTALILAQAAVGGLDDVPPSLLPLAEAALLAFLAHAAADPGGQLDEAVAFRAADPNLSPAEKDRLVEAARRVRAVHPAR